MKHPQNLNSFPLYSIGSYVRSPYNNQFPCSFYTPWTTYLWIQCEQEYLLFNFITLFNSRNWIISGYIFDDILKVLLSSRQPFQNQD